MPDAKVDKDLGAAVESGNLRDLTKALEQGANPNATFRTSDGELTALMIASIINFTEGARRLIAKGAKVNATTKRKETALHFAAIHGAANVAEVLLESGANPNAADKDKVTPLIAASGGTLAGPAPPLRAINAVSVLLNAGAPINTTDASGQTALHIAVGHGRADLAEFLISQGADINKADKNGETPLILASNLDHSECVSLLLKAGAKVAAKNKNSRTAIDLTSDKRIQKMLASRGAKPAQTQPEVAEEDEREDPEWLDAPVPKFEATPEFEQAVQALQRELNIAPMSLPKRPNTALFKMPEPRARKLAHDNASAKGVLRLWNPRGLLLLPSADHYAALACLQTNGTNYGLGPGNIIEGLRKIEAADPFRILGVDHDLVAGEFLSPVKNPKALADALYDICPDIVDQGMETVGRLAAHFKKRRDFLLWWD
jgi:ankyrin repeat protein